MARFKTRHKTDAKVFRRTAVRQRAENLPQRAVPRGGTRH